MDMLKSRGPRTDPCGTPKRTSKGDEKVFMVRTGDCRLVRQIRNDSQVTMVFLPHHFHFIIY
jgi:mRNA-degrading endonuclease RelE of RelBE toxin-antitoxin system